VTRCLRGAPQPVTRKATEAARHGLRRLPKPAQMERIAAAWRPYRSVACWYLRQALEVQPP
jgi:3-methyladenine DNA glycosylase/8-oxoguanine DNA glycosylase